MIFCQGMPFAADALAAAVARQTGSEVIVPPNPGTVGAMGIALLAARELDTARLEPAVLSRFLAAKVEQKDTFLCGSTRGCGGAGNHCRIERLRIAAVRQPRPHKPHLRVERIAPVTGAFLKLRRHIAAAAPWQVPTPHTYSVPDTGRSGKTMPRTPKTHGSTRLLGAYPGAMPGS